MNTSNIREYIDELYKKRLFSSYPRIMKEALLSAGVIVYGGGGWGQVILSEIMSHGVRPAWIIDANPNVIGKTIAGVKVQSPSSLNETQGKFVMLCSTHIKEMVNMCKKHNVTKWITPSAIRDWCPIPGEFGICSDGERFLDELTASYGLMADEKSRDVFRAFVRWHHIYDNDFTSLYDANLYFPADLRDRIDYSFFIDVGAYTGDTLNDWIKMFKPGKKKCCYFAFEPHPVSYEALKKNISMMPDTVQHNIEAVNIALGDKEGFIALGGLGAGSFVHDSDEGIQCKRIDDYFVSSCPTIIKADVEGNEMELLNGAKETIRRSRPALAISIYHHYSDIWRIPLWIHGLRLDYDIFLRHHQERFTDTVCYAIPR
jgi:FkbM family methyltransferase